MTKDQLGMNARISRRHFINGAAASLTAIATMTAWSKMALANTSLTSGTATNSTKVPYPPALTGMRGSHPGSFEIAHRLGREGEDAPIADGISDEYDLVVVGAGLSGLAAARKYQMEEPDTRILILDNHDDFGGHAKRNEFTVNGHFLIGYGGSQTLEDPEDFEDDVWEILDDIGFESDLFETAYDRSFYSSRGMQPRMFAQKLGEAENVHFPFTLSTISGVKPKPKAEDFAALPLSEQDRTKLQELLLAPRNYLADKNLSIEDKAEILIEGSYIDYLRDQCGLSETLISLFRQTTNANFAIAPDRVPAGEAWVYGNNAGFDELKIDLTDWIGEKKAKFEDNYIHHFPDGNASIARLLVRKMIPGSAPGQTMEDIVLAKFDYGKLDLPENKVRLRLSSTVVNVKPGDDETPAIVTYLKDGKAHAIKAHHCIMACYNMAIPYLIPDMEEEQAEALASNVKAPLVYTNIALTNWRAFHKLGANEIYCSDCFHCNMALDFPVSMGGYEFSKSPDDPIILHMEYCPALYGEDLDETERMRMGRVELLELSFEEIERRTREQLHRILGPYGFDVANDIAAITVNRWPHGYAGGDDHKIARRTIGNVAIANSDASGEAMAQAAISMGYRAVEELL